MPISRSKLINKGFTILELLIVVVILSILAAYVGPKYFKGLEKSKVGTAKSQMQSIAKALDLYRLDVGQYPTTSQGLIGLVQNPQEEKWKGPYLEKDLPMDPWGNQYRYAQPSLKNTSNEFDLYSYGGDGKEGGDKDNADIWY
ncbi:MAG: type II secretion system major pseudopilin GspG [Methylacidiphilales bacterium]|nr:type II secretion system major pseudopilin GspG [Candidatus Methylacidiphilales bacterium]